MSTVGDNVSSERIFQSKQICQGLKDTNKVTRKAALVKLKQYVESFKENASEVELRGIFDETYMYTINALRDNSEPVREKAIEFLTYFILDVLPCNDYFLTYVFPVLVERLGTVEIVEESEELRLKVLEFMRAIVKKYSGKGELKPFLNDCVTILRETVKDKFPVLKEKSCECIMELSKALPRDFHMQAESLVQPVLTAFTHQRYKIRLIAVKCVGVLIMHSSYKALDLAVGPLAERLFDQIPSVRREVAQVAARLLLEYRDRYSFFHKLLPLILTGLNDEIPETREESQKLWETIGLQYERENEKDLKDQLDYLTTLPKFYPKQFRRPNLGCRVLVQKNVGKIAPALAVELASWQADVQVRCSQLLCAIALHAEDGLTMHLQELLAAMYWSARNEDKRVVENILLAGEYIGLFVPVESWMKLILPAIENGAHFGHLSVLASLIRGAPQEYIKSDLLQLAKLLGTDDVCRSRKKRYQLELLKCIEAITSKIDLKREDSNEIGRYVFLILITLISIRDPENVILNVDLLESLRKALNLDSATDLWKTYSPYVLPIVNRDPESWIVLTVERCIFETFLLEAGEAFGENLEAIGEILSKALDTNCDAESRLRIFVALSTALDEKDVVFKSAKNLNTFLETLISDVLVPSLVWHAGRTAEAMRTMAASCLRSALTPKDGVDLFSSKELLQPIFERLLPLLLSLMEDASYKSRQLAIENVILLKKEAVDKGIWTLEYLLKIYPELLKRFDDPTDKVRICAMQSFPLLLENPPEDFLKDNFESHHELLIDTLLTHFDDEDEDFRKIVFGVLKSIAEINSAKLKHKVSKMRSLLRNKEGCDELLKHFEELKTS